MHRCFTPYLTFVTAIVVTCVLAVPGRTSAAPATAPSEPDALTAKGLHKNGSFLVLAGEKDVVDGMRPLIQLKNKFDSDAKQRVVYEQNIARANSAAAEWDYQRRDLDSKLATVNDPTTHNQLVAKVNVLTSQIGEAKQFRDENESKLRGLGDDTREQYINQVLELSGKADEVSKQYAQLATDTDVKAAATAAHVRLGPSPDFTVTANRLKMMRQGFSADTIHIKHDGNVPMVEVTLNGKTTRSFVLDTGASMVCLPNDLAKLMDMVPGPNDPIVHMQQADGKIIEAHQMTLKSVRVGTFTVENVECAVMPADLVEVEPLLGGTFLKNFIYKLDPNAEELHLARVGGAEKKTK